MSAGRSIAARLIFGLGTNPPGLTELTGKLAVYTLSRCCCRLHESSAQTRMNAALSGNRTAQEVPPFTHFASMKKPPNPGEGAAARNYRNYIPMDAPFGF